MTISAQDRAVLVALARQAVAAAVRGDAPPRPGELEGILAKQFGCFVTLTNHGHLRGCIGTFMPRMPLGETLVQMAQAAAADPRFVSRPITPQELGQLAVEVSVLSELSPADEPHKLTVGTHGIYIVRGRQAGCFLPEVATDMGWNAEEFLSYCCTEKAHLPPDAWKRPGTQVFLFTSEKFES